MDQGEFDVTLYVTDEQKKAIEDLFTNNGWDLKKHENKRRRMKTTVRRPAHMPIVDQREAQAKPQTSQETSSECKECYLDPCVTLRPNDWVGRGQSACQHNRSIRKQLYGKFWKCLFNAGGWNDQRYLSKKQRIGDGDTVFYHRKEIMPGCVLKKVAELYPNPPGVDYMGH